MFIAPMTLSIFNKFPAMRLEIPKGDNLKFNKIGKQDRALQRIQATTVDRLPEPIYAQWYAAAQCLNPIDNLITFLTGCWTYAGLTRMPFSQEIMELTVQKRQGIFCRSRSKTYKIKCSERKLK